MQKATCHPDRKHHALGFCSSCYYKDYAKRNPQTSEDYKRRNATPAVKACKLRWITKKKAENPRFIADRHRLDRYGLSAEAAWAKLEGQHGRCEICQETLEDKIYHIDHNHETNEVRGILCMACNTAIGKLKESEFILERAIAYLKRYQSLKPMSPGQSVEGPIRFVDLPKLIKKVRHEKPAPSPVATGGP